jgi:hypothetical protein
MAWAAAAEEELDAALAEAGEAEIEPQVKVIPSLLAQLPERLERIDEGAAKACGR